MNTLVIDIGYGHTKYCYDKENKPDYGKFPSAVVRIGRETIQRIEVENSVNNEELIYNGIRYVVGERAFEEGTPISTRRKDFVVTFSPLFIAKVCQETGREFSSIAISVAISDFTKEIKEALKKKLKRFMVNDKLYEFEEVFIFPQSYGIYRDVFPKGRKGTVTVADIGFNTIDLSVYKDGRAVKGRLMGFPGYGTSRFISNLVEKVSVELGEPVTELEINKAIEEGEKLRIYGKEVDISDLVKEEKEFYAEDVLAVIENSPLGRLWKTAEVRIIGGGGGWLIPEGIKKEKEILIPESPEYSNVRGLYKAVKAQLGGNNEE